MTSSIYHFLSRAALYGRSFHRFAVSLIPHDINTTPAWLLLVSYLACLPQVNIQTTFTAIMVALDIIKSSNDRIRSALPPGLVAVFVGATNGVGETTVRQFAKHANQPRVYIIGRCREAGDRIAAEGKELNPEGTFVFLQKETHLMRNVDEICNEIASKEEAVNLLFLSVGTLQQGGSEQKPLIWRHEIC